MGSPPKMKDGADAVEDAEILNIVIAVCRDGEEFLRYVADQVKGQQSRNAFLEMASVRSDIVQELESEVRARGLKPNETGTLGGKVTQWYSEAKGHFVDFDNFEFIEQLENVEKRSLLVLRKAVHEVKDQSLVYCLSSLVADIQMAHDRLRLLKQSFG